jgi:hypothetical protein
MNFSEKIAKRVLEIVDAGLVFGLGKAEPGKMCVEAAVCYALDLPHSDNPPCVGAAVRSLKIALNDGPWSSDAARTKGLRKLAIAQLGSDQIDQQIFTEYVALLTARKIVPVALRAAAKLVSAADAASLLEHAEKCSDAGDVAAAREAARAAANVAARAAYATARGAAYAAANASASAARGAADAADAAARGAAYAADAAARAAANAAARAAYATARAAAYAAHAAHAAHAADGILTMFADIALEALIICDSPGAQWLYLCEEA